MPKLSVIVPVYNEEKMVKTSMERLLGTKIPGITSMEVIVVDDGSRDRTLEEVGKIGDKRLVKLGHKINRGKGAAIRTALTKISGDLVVIQDADLEYDPADLGLLLSPILDGRAEVVYGSRFVGHGPHRVHLFWHLVANQALTLVSNMFTNLNLTDMETGYKAFSRKVAERLVIDEDRFGFEPEFTAKVSKMKVNVYEVGISYSGRSYDEGKKISWKDGVRALWVIVKSNLFA